MKQQLLLDSLADIILQNHRLDFTTFAEATHTVSLDNGKLIYSYDRLSLYVYYHNLTDEELNYLTRKIMYNYRQNYCKEAQKRREEFESLLIMFLLDEKFTDYTIEKHLKPDFVLLGQQNIGIEVTEFTSESYKVITNIVDQHFRKGRTSEEIEIASRRKHGAKTNNYSFFDIFGTAVVGSPLIDIPAAKATHANQIIGKHIKYRDSISKYDEFIILCDARRSTAVTCLDDARDIIEIAKESCNLSNCSVYILYSDTSHLPQLSVFRM